MKHIVWIGFLLIQAGILSSQSVNPFFELPTDTTTNWSAGLFGSYSAGSSAITNELMNSFYTGRFITDAQKQRVESKLRSSNRLGGDADGGLYYLHKRDSLCHTKISAWFVAVKERNHVNARFSKDLFKLAFEGNSQYRGQTADLGNFNLNLQQYQQFQAGVLTDHFGISLSVYSGQQFLELQAKKAQLYTSTYGDHLDFNTSYRMALSDPSHTGAGASNGIGSGLDLFARMPLTLSNGQKADLIVELGDLGFIRWNAKTRGYQNDTSYHFDGFTLKNAFQLGDTSLHYTPKSAVHVHVQEKGAYGTALPTLLDIKFVPQGIHYQFVLGLWYRFSADCVPYGYARFLYHLSPRFRLSLEAGYGGYARFQTGLQVQGQLTKGFTVKAGTQNMLAYFSPAQSWGQGVYVSLSKSFR
jgi:hypothetical protein